MQVINEENWKRAVKAVSEGSALLAIDFDGVIAEIAQTSDNVAIPETINRIRQAALILPTAIVSGRSVPFLQEAVGVEPVWYSGMYGRQLRTPNGKITVHEKALRNVGSLKEAGREIRERLLDESLLDSGLGVTAENHFDLAYMISFKELVADKESLKSKENKTSEEVERLAALSEFHSRAEPRVRALADEIATRHGLATQKGSKLIRLMCRGFDKGLALGDVIESVKKSGRNVDSVIFLGDDTHDVSAFRLIGDLEGQGKGQGIGGCRVTVGENPPQELLAMADVHLQSPKKLPEFLDQIFGRDMILGRDMSRSVTSPPSTMTPDSKGTLAA